MSNTNPPDENGRNSLGKRIAFGTVWVMASRLLVRGMGLINTLILARLLVPEDFGLVAIGVTLMQLLQNFSDIGVSQTVIRFRQASSQMIDTLFTLSALRGLAVAIVLLALVPLAPMLFGDPRAAGVIAAISIAPLVLGLKNPRFFEFERDLDFSRTFRLEAIAKSLSVIVAVSIALVFRTYWAIIIGILAGAVAEVCASYLLRTYRPRISFQAFSDLIGFTGWLAAVSFVTALNNKLDTLLLPKLAGASATGVFHVGHQIADIPTEEIATPMARAIYPGLSELQEDREQMNRTFLQGVEVLGAVGLPAAIGCAFVAEDLVALLLGDNWQMVAPVLQIYGPAAALVMLFAALQGFAIARDLTKVIFWREVAYFLFRTPLFIWAAFTFGLIGAIAATAAGAAGNGHRDDVRRRRRRLQSEERDEKGRQIGNGGSSTHIPYLRDRSVNSQPPAAYNN